MLHKGRARTQCFTDEQLVSVFMKDGVSLDEIQVLSAECPASIGQ